MSKLEGKEPHTLVSDEAVEAAPALPHQVEDLLNHLRNLPAADKNAIWHWLVRVNQPVAIATLIDAVGRPDGQDHPIEEPAPVAQPPMPHQFTPMLGSRLCEVCSFDKWHALHRAWDIAQRQPAAQ